jgi:hypothetical protein
VSVNSPPYWVADPVEATLVPGLVASVTLTMHRNGQAAVGVDFAEGTCANGVQDGSETGTDCGGECLPCASGVGQGGQPGAVDAPARPLLFSEYVEGSSTYKALELLALADSTLDGCRVEVYSNGSSTSTGTTLAGALAAGERHVLCTSSLIGLVAACDQSAGLSFNGNDAITVECDGAVVDAIGQVGVDPGTAFSGAGVSLLDQTLRRKCNVSHGDVDASNAFDPSSEWDGHPLDTFDDLGLRTCP